MATTLAELVMKVRLENKVVLQELKNMKSELQKVEAQSKATERSVQNLFKGLKIGSGVLGIAAIRQGLTELGNFGEKLREINNLYEQGKLSASEWRAAAMGSIPLFGGAYAAGEQFFSLINPNLKSELDARDKMKEMRREEEENRKKIAEAEERNRQKKLDDLEKERKLQQELRELTTKNAKDAREGIADFMADSPEEESSLQYYKDLAQIQEWINSLIREYNQNLRDANGEWWRVDGSMDSILAKQKELQEQAANAHRQRIADIQKQEQEKQIRKDIDQLDRQRESIEVGQGSVSTVMDAAREYTNRRNEWLPSALRGPFQAMNSGAINIPSLTMPSMDGIDKLVNTSVQQLAELKKINTTLQTKKAALG